jgi:cytochrome c-type biogenesis protein CcmF
MIAELGHFALILALAIAAVQATIPMIGAQRGDAAWMDLAPWAAVGQFVFVTLAFASLTHAYLTSDFSVAAVFQNSHTAKPLLYKISGVWANHEGSMVLWVLILAVYGMAVAAFGANLPPKLKARVLAVQGMIGFAFLLYIVATSNPFARIDPAPVQGQGLNPLLQDPGLAFHPPLLYLGYVGYSMTFSFAVAALIDGRVEPAWARWVRPWTLAAWTFLTAGIALGSWWAYYELGWGGWWFWDPVENASFLPWLTGTALLHSAIVVEKRDSLKAWTVLLAIVAFAFSLLGTFLVRSGVLTSVHTFASDPSRGIFILALLVVTVGGAFILFAWRGPGLRATGTFQPVSREGALMLNNLLLTTAAAAVLLGTLYPLFLDAVGGGKVSVGKPYFDAVFVPLMVPLIAAMAVGPQLSWKRADLLGAFQRLNVALGAALAGLVAVWFLFRPGAALAAVGIALALWLFAATLSELAGRIHLFRTPFAVSWRRLLRQPRSSWGMTLAHGGLAIAIAGMTASSAWTVESIQVMRPGESVKVAGYEFTFTGADRVTGPNYVADRGSFAVARGGEPVVTLNPEKRIYDTSRQPTTEAAIHPTFLGDLYAVIGDPDARPGAPPGGWVTRLYFNPLVPWMWAGALIMVLGGVISLSDRRHRVGAPARRRRDSTTAAAQQA